MFHRTVRGLAVICGYLAAVFLAGIAVATLTQIIARQLGEPVETTELSGFFLAASSFLGLAYTFVNGGHVRIGLVSQFASDSWRQRIEIAVCLVAGFVVAYAAWHMAAFTYETYRFGDLSPGFLAAPLWIPQSAVSFGLSVLFLAIVEQTMQVIAGREPDYATNIDNTGE